MPDDEEEETQQRSAGRPNLYWARVREEQERDVFKGEYRAVRLPRSGPQSVGAEDVQGSYDLCWCGLPEGHDWVGKDRGRKHPRKVDAVTAGKAEQPSVDNRVSKRELNGFDDDVSEIIVAAVNIYGLRYRLTKTGVYLYPKDGSPPHLIHKGARPRSIKAMRLWFIKHVVELDKVNSSGLVRPGNNAADLVANDLERKLKNSLTEDEMDDAIGQLARELNSPEHQPTVEAPTPTKKAVANPRLAHVTSKKAATPPQSTEARPERVRKERGDTMPYATKPGIVDWRNPEGQWGPYRRKKDGLLVEGFERMGATNQIRCTQTKADGSPCGWTGTGQAMAGHMLNHDPERRESLWGDAAQEKKKRTVYTAHVTEKVQAALDILHEAVGYQPPEPETNTAEVKELTKKVKDLERQMDHLIAERDEVQARLDLMREALRA